MFIPTQHIASKLSFNFFYFYLCSKHDLKDMFKLTDVMQGSYTVLAHVGGPLCPECAHRARTKLQSESCFGSSSFHLFGFSVIFSLSLHVFL